MAYLGEVLIIRQATSESDRRKIFELRYRVYCKEKKYLSIVQSQEEIENDEFDECSVHYIAFNSGTEAVGTIRLILNSPIRFPINKYFDIPEDGSKDIAEVSRLIVLKEERSPNHSAMLHLCKAIYDYSIENNIKHWYAILDEHFLKLSQRLGFIFKQIAESKFCYGDITAPYILCLEETIANLKTQNPNLHQFFYQPLKVRINELAEL